MKKDEKNIKKEISIFFKKMDIKIDCEIEQDEGMLRIDISPIDAKITPLLIGYKGENLASIQHIVRIMLRKKTASDEKILLDVNGYRKEQQNLLRQTIEMIAARVKETGRVELLRPMSAFERRMVHVIVKDVGGLLTQSVGEEPNRRVLIKPEGSEQ